MIKSFYYNIFMKFFFLGDHYKFKPITFMQSWLNIEKIKHDNPKSQRILKIFVPTFIKFESLKKFKDEIAITYHKSPQTYWLLSPNDHGCEKHNLKIYFVKVFLSSVQCVFVSISKTPQSVFRNTTFHIHNYTTILFMLCFWRY